MNATMNDRLSIAEAMVRFRELSPFCPLPDDVWAIIFVRALGLEFVTDELLQKVNDWIKSRPWYPCWESGKRIWECV